MRRRGKAWRSWVLGTSAGPSPFIPWAGGRSFHRHAFDNDPAKVGQVITGCTCYQDTEISLIVAEQDIRVAIITVPASEAQKVADTLVEAGVKGILNFAPARLRVPPEVYVENMERRGVAGKGRLLRPASSRPKGGRRRLRRASRAGDEVPKMPSNKSFVETIKERCRVCYTCVRECPAKAIRISDGQAEIIGQRCIGCGNCVRVCSQPAKQVLGTIADVGALLAPGADGGLPGAQLSRRVPRLSSDARGMLRAWASARSPRSPSARTWWPSLPRTAGEGRRQAIHRHHLPGGRGLRRALPSAPRGDLAPIVSPMVATARCLRRLYGPELRSSSSARASPRSRTHTFLVGARWTPCSPSPSCGNVRGRGDGGRTVAPGEFDPPRAGSGALFPISRGLLQTAGSART